MAHHKSAKKRVRSDAKRRARNKQYLSRVRTAIKSFRLAVAARAKGAKDTDEEKISAEKVATGFRTVQALLARACRKGIIHKNTAARRTKRLYLLLKRASAQAD